MSEHRTSEEWAAGQLVYWHRETGPATTATVVKASKTGKRIRISYEYHPSWTGGKLGIKAWAYVKPTNLSKRYE